MAKKTALNSAIINCEKSELLHLVSNIPSVSSRRPWFLNSFKVFFSALLMCMFWLICCFILFCFKVFIWLSTLLDLLASNYLSFGFFGWTFVIVVNVLRLCLLFACGYFPLGTSSSSELFLRPDLILALLIIWSSALSIYFDNIFLPKMLPPPRPPKPMEDLPAADDAAFIYNL